MDQSWSKLAGDKNERKIEGEKRKFGEFVNEAVDIVLWISIVGRPRQLAVSVTGNEQSNGKAESFQR